MYSLPSTRSNESRRAAFWRGHLASQSSSGLSIRAYCREQGLTEPSFYQWRKRLSRENPLCEPAHPMFVPVRIQPAPALEDKQTVAIEVALGNGRVLRVRPGFDAATLQRVVSALEAETC